MGTWGEDGLPHAREQPQEGPTRQQHDLGHPTSKTETMNFVCLNGPIRSTLLSTPDTAQTHQPSTGLGFGLGLGSGLS